MKIERLTSDNPSLSRVTLGVGGTASSESDDIITSQNGREPDQPAIPDHVAELVSASVSANTVKAYQSDLAHFHDWGGTLPATPSKVAEYIADHAGSLALATMTRRIATLAKAHGAMGVANPCRSELVRATLQGFKRKHGTAQTQAKPLMREDLFLVLDAMRDTLGDIRDRALLLIGFAGGFRRSELTGLHVADLTPVRQGLIITLRRSKTDQTGEGRKIGIPHGRTRHCPVAAVERWTRAAQLIDGPLFRPVSRHGHLTDAPLTGDAVSTILRRRVAAAGIDPLGYSGHSLRAGFATSAAQAGVSTSKIRAQTGHASDVMLARYIRDGEIFEGNAAGALL